MTNESNTTTTALALRCLTALYPLSTNHYPPGGPNPLPVKRLPISHCDSRTCRDEIRNPMILNNFIEGGGGEADAPDGFRSMSRSRQGQISYNESYSGFILNKLIFNLTKLSYCRNISLELQPMAISRTTCPE